MQQMLDAGANIDAADSKGLMPLHVACTSGKQRAAQLLVSRGASLEATCRWGLTPLHHASQKGHLEVVQLLVNANASLTAVMKDFESTPVHLAAAAGHHQVVQLLINSGAQLDAKDSRGLMALHAASDNNHTQAVQCLLDADSTPAHVDAQGSEGTPLHMACLKGREQVVPLLIKAGADVNARTPAERTPLHQAAISGHKTIVQQLLAAGADPGALTRTGAYGLHVAAMRGFQKIVKQLLAVMDSAAVEAVYDGKTPLQHAVYNRQTKCVKVLLAAGADPDKLYGAEDGDNSLAGATVLHKAAQLEYAAVVPLLATPRNMRRLWKGKTALHLALTKRWSWQRRTDTSAAKALVTAGSPVGVANAEGITALALAAGSGDAGVRALVPAMVRMECARYKQLQQGAAGQQRQRQQQDEEEGVEEQEPAAVLAAVFASVSALLEATAAADLEAAAAAEGTAAGAQAASAGEGSSHQPLLGCFKAVLEVLGEAAAGDMLQQLLSKAPCPSDTTAAASSRTLLLYQVFVKAWLAELQPLMQQRWGMTNWLAALVAGWLAGWLAAPTAAAPKTTPSTRDASTLQGALGTQPERAVGSSGLSSSCCWSLGVARAVPGAADGPA
jgi:ankyrin repeat protein